MDITLLGHACIRIDAAGGGSVLVDPGAFSPDAATGATGIDSVLVTHQHADHVEESVLRQVLEAADVPVLAEAGAADIVDEAGVAVQTLTVGDSHTWSSLHVEVVGGDHAMIHPDLPAIGNLGLILDDGTSRLFHPGDSYGTVPADVDVLALPLSAPWADVAATVDFARAVGPRLIVPIHDGLLRPQARAIYVGLVRSLSGAEVADPDQGIPFAVSG